MVAEELHLVDKNNTSRMILYVESSNGQPSLQLNGEDGLARIQIALNPDGSPVISLSRPDGKGLIGLGANRGSGVGLSINDQEGNIAIHLCVFSDGARQIDIYDAKGKPVWSAR
ncbi:MAG TPA: hypothetical protein VGM05_21710 [Planctomycetaceae bacterium]